MMFLDEEIYKSLEWIVNNAGVESLGLDFTIQGEDLKPNGSFIDVTDSNKEEYLKLVLQHYMHKSIQKQWEALMKGLQEIVCINALKVFDHQQLDLILCGRLVT